MNLISHSVFYAFMLALMVLIATTIGSTDTVSTDGSIDNSFTSTGFFTNHPVFIGLPAWVLTGYSIFVIWGGILLLAWGISILHGGF